MKNLRKDNGHLKAQEPTAEQQPPAMSNSRTRFLCVIELILKYVILHHSLSFAEYILYKPEYCWYSSVGLFYTMYPGTKTHVSRVVTHTHHTIDLRWPLIIGEIAIVTNKFGQTLKHLFSTKILWSFLLFWHKNFHYYYNTCYLWSKMQ